MPETEPHGSGRLLVKAVTITLLLLGIAVVLAGRVRHLESAVPLATNDTRSPLAERDAPILVGPPAPDFTLPDLDGTLWNLSQFRGRPLVLFFWATW